MDVEALVHDRNTAAEGRDCPVGDREHFEIACDDDVRLATSRSSRLMLMQAFPTRRDVARSGRRQ